MVRIEVVMKTFKATWTIDPANNIDDLIGEEFSKRIQEEIDWEIMADIFIQLGWHRVSYEPRTSETIAKEMKDWLAENCIGNYQFREGTAVFEKEQDLIMYKLRWL